MTEVCGGGGDLSSYFREDGTPQDQVDQARVPVAWFIAAFHRSITSLLGRRGKAGALPLSPPFNSFIVRSCNLMRPLDGHIHSWGWTRQPPTPAETFHMWGRESSARLLRDLSHQQTWTELSDTSEHQQVIKAGSRGADRTLYSATTSFHLHTSEYFADAHLFVCETVNDPLGTRSVVYLSERSSTNSSKTCRASRAKYETTWNKTRKTDHVLLIWYTFS